MKNRIRFIGLRNLVIVTAVFLALLFAVDRLIPVFSVHKDPEEDYSDSAGYLRLEKTPVESILTVAEARKMCRTYNVDISGYSINAYPLIGDMPSTEAVDGDTVNILVIGDSFVWGDNSVNRNELFWRQTEHMLRAEGYNCRVTAVGMASASAYEELRWYENYLKENRPDLVVFGYVYNDPEIPADDAAAAEETDEREDNPDLFPVLSPVRVLFPNIYQSLISYIVAKTMYAGKYDEELKGYDAEILKGEVRAYYQENFADRLDAITKETGIPSVVMTLPSIPGSLLYKAFFEPLPEIYAGTSVAFYDSYPAFDRFYSAKHKKNLYVNAGNDHPGSAVHYFYASFLTELLKNDFGAVLGEKQNGSLQSRVICVNECTPCGIGLETAAQSASCARYTFTYPEKGTHTHLLSSTDRYWLTEPLGKRYIKLSFENPVDLSGLELTGAPAGKTELYYTRINKALGYDDNTLYPVALTENGAGLSGAVRDERITSVCIHIDEDAAVQGVLELNLNG